MLPREMGIEDLSYEYGDGALLQTLAIPFSSNLSACQLLRFALLLFFIRVTP